jgi:2-iminoacetate synthase ThiH
MLNYLEKPTTPRVDKLNNSPSKKNANIKKLLIKLGVYKLIALVLRKTSGFPIWSNLEIDIQSACNRDCEFCPRYHDRSGIRKDAYGRQIMVKMPSEQVYQFIAQASRLGFKGKIKLHRLSDDAD